MKNYLLLLCSLFVICSSQELLCSQEKPNRRSRRLRDKKKKWAKKAAHRGSALKGLAERRRKAPVRVKVEPGVVGEELQVAQPVPKSVDTVPRYTQDAVAHLLRAYFLNRHNDEQARADVDAQSGSFHDCMRFHGQQFVDSQKRRGQITSLLTDAISLDGGAPAQAVPVKKEATQVTAVQVKIEKPASAASAASSDWASMTDALEARDGQTGPDRESPASVLGTSNLVTPVGSGYNSLTASPTRSGSLSALLRSPSDSAGRQHASAPGFPFSLALDASPLESQTVPHIGAPGSSVRLFSAWRRRFNTDFDQ